MTALVVAPDHSVYGGTSAEPGRGAYLFRVDGHSVRNAWSLEDALPGQERIVRSLVVARDGRVFGGTANHGALDGARREDAGGHLFSFDPVKGRFADHGIPVAHEGFVSAVMDTLHQRVYLLTAPGGHLVRWDLAEGRIRDLGPTVPGPSAVREPRGNVVRSYRPRALVVDRAGRVYGSGGGGSLWRYDPDSDSRRPLTATIPGARGREEDWLYEHVVDAFCAAGDRLYGGTRADGYLFHLDPVSGLLINLGKPVHPSGVVALAQARDGHVYGLFGGVYGPVRLARFDPETRSMEDLGVVSLDMWTWTVYRAGAMVAHPGGELVIGEAERLGAVVFYDPAAVSRGADHD